MTFFPLPKWAAATIGRLKLTIISNQKSILLIWLAVTLIFVIDSWITSRLNNYLIFENTFRNLLHQSSLYKLYPQRHFDANHYGPVFTLIIAPFAIFPNWMGLLLWNIFNCLVLFITLQSLPITENQRRIIGLISVPCLIESMLNQQFNPVAAAMIILNFTLLNKNKGIISSLMMVLGIFVKLYGIVGIAFLPFVKNKPRYILFSLMWACIIYAAPMLLSSASFINGSYLEWFSSLVNKNAANIGGIGRDMSVMGFFRSLFGIAIGNLYFLILGAALFLIPYINYKSYSHKGFQLLILSSALIFPIIFSTGAEDCTFIIAIPGVGIWFISEKNDMIKKMLLPVLLIITCNFPLLFFPAYTQQYPILLSSISFIYFIVWLRVLYLSVTYKSPIMKVLRN